MRINTGITITHWHSIRLIAQTLTLTLTLNQLTLTQELLRSAPLSSPNVPSPKELLFSSKRLIVPNMRSHAFEFTALTVWERHEIAIKVTLVGEQAVKTQAVCQKHPRPIKLSSCGVDFHGIARGVARFTLPLIGNTGTVSAPGADESLVILEH